jgi:cell fate (sporulation/competence/biofilm development) regulator YlbF (YheA/YmcA/DUF963 family)
MSIDADTEGSDATESDPDPETLGRTLGEAIAELPAYQEFEEAKAAVEADDRLQEQIRAFERRREEFGAARARGETDEEDVAELKRAQEELHAHPKMSAYLDAKSQLQTRLESVNEAVSEPLVVDFGGEAGGCCQE